MDLKDLKDPNEYGKALLNRREAMGSDLTLSEVHDALLEVGYFHGIERLNPEYSTCVETQAQYRREMEEEAHQGYTEARIVCAEHGWGDPEWEVLLQEQPASISRIVSTDTK